VDRARAERDVARAEIERIRAVIERKTIRAPFRARVGLVDLHPGQYLEQGSVLTTLQGVEEAVHVDFAVAQEVAAELAPGQGVRVQPGGGAAPLAATIVAVDARVDPATRNALVRARIEDAAAAPAPGSSVRVLVPVGAPVAAVAVPVTALRRGPEGDHVFVVAAAPDGRPRARARAVRAGAAGEEEVLILEGLEAGETVAASGSFKLRDGTLVSIAAAEEERSR
jgi:membrane fusion protein (multidrug efflux system)